LFQPYCGVSVRNDENKQIYNHRLSGAHWIVENALSILTQKYSFIFWSKFNGILKTRIK
jgi:hypothetical protein